MENKKRKEVETPEEKQFEATVSILKKMSVIRIDRSRRGNVINGETEIDVTDKSSEEIDNLIAAILKAENNCPEPEWLTIYYYINVYESLTDNREIYGHKNQTSLKFIRPETNKIYVSGEVYTLAGFLAKINSGKLSTFARDALYEYITDCGFDKHKLSNEELSTTLIKIESDFPVHVLFEEFQKGHTLKTVKTNK